MKNHPLVLKFNDTCVGSFSVELLPRMLFGSEYRQPHPIHESVIRPLLRVAEDCLVYNATQLPGELFEDICVSKRNGVFRLDVKKELLIGREYLWNASARERGSIVIVVPNMRDELNAAFDMGQKPYAWATRYQLNKGHTASAVSYAICQAESGKVVVLFSASNGIRQIDVIAPEPEISRLMEEAEARGADEYEFTWRK